jgi:hypothetical protein
LWWEGLGDSYRAMSLTIKTTGLITGLAPSGL